MRAVWAKIGSGYGDWLWRAVYYSQGMIYGRPPFWAHTPKGHTPFFTCWELGGTRHTSHTLPGAIIYASQILERLISLPGRASSAGSKIVQCCRGRDHDPARSWSPSSVARCPGRQQTTSLFHEACRRQFSRWLG